MIPIPPVMMAANSSLEGPGSIALRRHREFICKGGSRGLKGVCLLLLMLGFAASVSEITAQDAPLVAEAVAAEPKGQVILKTDDIVGINVFGEESLSGAFRIGPDGAMVFPLLGSIPAAGKTAEDLGSDIKTRLEKDYIRSAQVAVAITEEAKLAPNSVTVIGQVMRPGQVTFEQGATLDLFTAISFAGGLAERADKNRIELKRREGEDLRTQIFNLEGDRVTKLKDKDTLIVHALPEEKKMEEVIQTVTVIGEVRTPGQVPMKKEQPLDIITAIAMAGGFTDVARPSRIFIRRVVDGQVQTFEVNVSKMQKDNSAPFMLLPDDTVTVPQSVF